MSADPKRRLTASRVALAVLAATLSGSSAALALPAGVTTLTGKSRNLPVKLTYASATRSVNGFTVEYTCRGKKPQTDSDIYTIADRGDDSEPLARARAKRRIKATLTGRITRFSEDGQRRIGTGKLVLDARVYQSSSKRVIRGRMRVRSGSCPSARWLRLRVVRPR